MSHRPFTRRPTAALAGLAMVALAATGCGGGDTKGGGTAAGGSSGETTTIRIGTLPTANAAAMYLGMQEGFFEDEGLKVEPTVLQGGNEIITGMVSGDYDFGFVGYISAGVAAGKGVPICVATASDAAGTSPDDDFQVYVAAGNSPINGPKDFAGKTLGINALGGVAEVMTRAALDKEGVDSKSVKFIEVPFPEVPAAVAGGRIDAGFTAEPFVTTVLDQGGKVVFAPQSDLGAQYPNGSYATSKQYYEKNGDVVKRFDAAITKSLEYAQANPEAVRKIIPTYTKIPPEVASRMRLPVFTADLDKKAIGEQMSFLKKYGLVDKAPSADDLICG
jgi:NitT/TauT family transport system substrate-binding protein